MNKPVYAITALRWDGQDITDAMMGMLDPHGMAWDRAPAPTRASTVVDRLLDGDTVVTLWPDLQAPGRLGPRLQIGVSPRGLEQIALPDGVAGQRLQDLPRF